MVLDLVEPYVQWGPLDGEKVGIRLLDVMQFVMIEGSSSPSIGCEPQGDHNKCGNPSSAIFYAVP